MTCSSRLSLGTHFYFYLKVKHSWRIFPKKIWFWPFKKPFYYFLQWDLNSNSKSGITSSERNSWSYLEYRGIVPQISNTWSKVIQASIRFDFYDGCCTWNWLWKKGSQPALTSRTRSILGKVSSICQIPLKVQNNFFFCPHEEIYDRSLAYRSSIIKYKLLCKGI